MKNDLPTWLSVVHEKVASLRYGVVQIVIHDSRITQIERTEKIRFENNEAADISRITNRDKSNRPDILEVP